MGGTVSPVNGTFRRRPAYTTTMKALPILLLALSPALFAQPLQFEVASVRPSAPAAVDTVNVGLRMDGQQAHITSFSLRDYIAMAYEVRAAQIKGPEWLTEGRFDVHATLPAGAKMDQFPVMLQGLLAERFQLQFHREQKEFSVYALLRGTRPLALKPVAVDASATDGTVNVAATGSGAGVSVNLGGGASYSFANNKLEGKKLDMPTLVDTLQNFMDRPMVDRTELKGFYDVTLDVTAEDYRVMLIRAGTANGLVLPPQAMRLIDGATTPSLFDSIEKQGLKLDPRKEMLDVIVVDQVLKIPTEN
jgi:uncharacterized protein (TIGR03435 family)